MNLASFFQADQETLSNSLRFLKNLNMTSPNFRRQQILNRLGIEKLPALTMMTEFGGDYLNGRTYPIRHTPVRCS
jgi:hypothetical protein